MKILVMLINFWRILNNSTQDCALQSREWNNFLYITHKLFVPREKNLTVTLRFVSIFLYHNY